MFECPKCEVTLIATDKDFSFKNRQLNLHCKNW
jgi:hypothetical protein